MRSRPFLPLPISKIPKARIQVRDRLGELIPGLVDRERLDHVTFSLDVNLAESDVLAIQSLKDWQELGLRIVGSVYCPATRYRKVESTPLDLTAGSRTCEVTVSLEDIGRSAEVSFCVVGDLVAGRLNSLIDMPAVRLVELGSATYDLSSASRQLTFITESFSKTVRARVPWEVRTSYTDWADDYRAGLHVYINKDFPESKELESDKNRYAVYALTLEILKAATTSLAGLVDDRALESPDELSLAYPESVLAAVVSYADLANTQLSTLVRLATSPDGAQELSQYLSKVAAKYVF